MFILFKILNKNISYFITLIQSSDLKSGSYDVSSLYFHSFLSHGIFTLFFFK